MRDILIFLILFTLIYIALFLKDIKEYSRLQVESLARIEQRIRVSDNVREAEAAAKQQWIDSLKTKTPK